MSNTFDAEIKVNNWNKIIKVNPKGDTIVLNIGDNSLIKNLVNILTDIQNISLELDKTNEEINKDNILEKLDFSSSKIKEISSKIDTLFGDNTCIKVFSTNTPFIDDILDFIYQMCELVEKFTGEKVANLENIKNKFLDKQKKRRNI